MGILDPGTGEDIQICIYAFTHKSLDVDAYAGGLGVQELFETRATL